MCEFTEELDLGRTSAINGVLQTLKVTKAEFLATHMDVGFPLLLLSIPTDSSMT
jgi:hypothetical protein